MKSSAADCLVPDLIISGTPEVETMFPYYVSGSQVVVGNQWLQFCVTASEWHCLVHVTITCDEGLIP